jgi:hypothetical protein
MEGLAQWSADYDAKKAAFYAIRAKGLFLTEEQHQKFMSEFAGLRHYLKKVNTELGIGTIPPSDLARREVLISNLEDAVRRAYVPKATNLGTSGNSFGSNGSREQSMIDGGVFNPMELSGHGLMLHNKATIKLQDEIIQEIGSGVERLHQHAVTIGEEAKIHNTLLSALDDNVDAGAEALRTEAKHAEDVRQKSRMCHLYICLVVEILTLVILAIVYMNHGK